MGTDSLYHIMDYSGHYYRTDKADQLVAVAGEQDATVFTFAQANSRICGRKASFYCMVPIEETEENTNKEVSGSDEKSDNFSALQVEEHEENNDNEFASPIKELTYNEMKETTEKNSASYDLSEMDWAEYLTHYTYIVEGLKDYRDELSKRHSDIDQKICDILHYIELCETDDNEAVDLIELLRVCRENRRDANCNVTQGYKVFKRLKELRLEKKAKTKELNCLYALTDYIDCKSLADTCEDNLSEIEDIMGVPGHSQVTEMQSVDDEQEENMNIAEDVKNMVG